MQRPRFNPQVRKMPWSRKQLPTPVLLPGEVHGQRRLMGYSPWGGKESVTFIFTTIGAAGRNLRKLNFGMSGFD